MKKLGLFLLVVLTVTACGGKKGKVEAEKEIKYKNVKVAEVNKSEIEKTYSSNGDLDISNEVYFMTPTGGDVENIYFENGEKVKKGDKIVVLDNPAVESYYYQAKANYMNSKSNYEKGKKFLKEQFMAGYVASESAYISAGKALEKAERGAKIEELDRSKLSVATAKSGYELAKTTFEKQSRLYEEKLISEDTFLQVKNGYETAKNGYETAMKNNELLIQGADSEDLEQMRAALKSAKESYDLQKKLLDDKSWNYDLTALKSANISAKANYEAAKDSFDDLTVVAKFSGVVADMDLKKYQSVEKETMLCGVVDNRVMEVVIGIPGGDVENIKVSDEVKIFVEELEKSYVGKIAWINPVADKGSKQFSVKIKVENIDGKMKKGMYSKVTLKTGRVSGILVPKKAIVVKNLFKYIFVKNGDRVEKIRVESGIDNGEYVEVISDKIESGDKIIVEGQSVLEDSDYVKEVK